MNSLFFMSFLLFSMHVILIISFPVQKWIPSFQMRIKLRSEQSVIYPSLIIHFYTWINILLKSHPHPVILVLLWRLKLINQKLLTFITILPQLSFILIIAITTTKFPMLYINIKTLEKWLLFLIGCRYLFIF